MNFNYLAIIVATLLQFICGAVWYGPLFAKLWGKIHGFDQLPKEVQKKMMKSMAPFYLLQLLVTIITTFVFALLLNGFPSTWNVFGLAGFFWLGFVVPTQVSAVIFGGTDPKWIVKKVAVMAGGSLLCLEVAAAVLHLMP